MLLKRGESNENRPKSPKNISVFLQLWYLSIKRVMYMTSRIVGGASSHGLQKGLIDSRSALVCGISNPSRSATGQSAVTHDFDKQCKFLTMLSQASLTAGDWTPALRNQSIWINAGCQLVWATITFLFFSLFQSFLCCSIICSTVCSAYEIWHAFSHLLTPCVECMRVCRPIFWPTFLSRVILTLSWLNVTLGLLLLLVWVCNRPEG